MQNVLAFQAITSSVNAPDGEYTLAVNSLDYKDTDPNNNTFRDYFAKRKVEVKGGNVRLYDLIAGCYDLHEQTGYWGAYIDGLEYNASANAIFVEFGS
jgi:hypothetical protein